MSSFNREIGNKLAKRGWNIFDAKHDNANGYDLTIEKNYKTYRVEIKKVVKGTRCFKVKPLGKSGSKSDAVALCFPCGNIILYPIEEYKSLCNKSGERFITDLVRLNSAY